MYFYGHVGELPWPIIRDTVDGIITVTDESVTWAMKLLMTRLKTVVEPSGAVATAAAFTEKFLSILESEPKISKIGVLICGGNIDMENFFSFH